MGVQYPAKSQSSEAQGGVIQGKIPSWRIEGAKPSIWIKKQLALLAGFL